MNNKIIFALIALAVFIAAAGLGYYGPAYLAKQPEPEETQAFIPAAVPEPLVRTFAMQFSNLSAATKPMRLPEDVFLNTDREERRFSDFAGKPTLVNFWATWCAPCVVELPALEKLAKYYEGRMNVIAVALETDKNTDDISSFLEKRMLGDFAGYLDSNGEMMNSLGLQGLPTSFLLGSDGLILYRFEGDADWTREDSRAFFDAFLLQKR